MAAVHTDNLTDDSNRSGPEGRRATFVFDVDDITYEYNRPTITGTEVMTLAGIAPSEGLIQILPDGTRKTVDPDDTIHLVPGVQFKRRPRFKRG
ncbi:multiubiquitin domain-containing protein [Streptomyces sp. NPDC050263]|uniref:multiubiquitin domain-containing protein n=1 Tax=Streptomyces sp. NPDC050263 TaxID=3155037 RepID=UPI00343EF241